MQTHHALVIREIAHRLDKHDIHHHQPSHGRARKGPSIISETRSSWYDRSAVYCTRPSSLSLRTTNGGRGRGRGSWCGAMWHEMRTKIGVKHPPKYMRAEADQHTKQDCHENMSTAKLGRKGAQMTQSDSEPGGSRAHSNFIVLQPLNSLRSPDRSSGAKYEPALSRFQRNSSPVVYFYHQLLLSGVP